MTSYTITKYQYYEYSLDDYNNIRHAFFLNLRRSRWAPIPLITIGFAWSFIDEYVRKQGMK